MIECPSATTLRLQRGGNSYLVAHTARLTAPQQGPAQSLLRQGTALGQSWQAYHWQSCPASRGGCEAPAVQEHHISSLSVGLRVMYYNGRRSVTRYLTQAMVLYKYNIL